MGRGRVAPGGFPPGAPTDPDVRDSRIRLLASRLRYTMAPKVAIRCCFVDTLSGLDVLGMFHSSGSMMRHPLPFTGSSRGEFPGFDGTMGCSDSRTSIPPRFVAFAWRYHTGDDAFVGRP
jgi:hypothetical protein